MKPLASVPFFLLTILITISSCQKEVSEEVGSGGGPGGGGGGNNYNPSCNNKVMQVKRIQATFDNNQYTELTWNTDGTVKSIKIQQQLTSNMTAVYIYASGKIKEGVLYYNEDPGVVVDTVVYHYNSDGKVDSIYRKNDNGFNFRLRYSGGKLVKVERVESDGSLMYYWDVTMDSKNNIIKGEEYWNDGNGVFEKESTFHYTRDDRKNPLAGMAEYMLFFLDDEYAIFRDWGPNNYIDQRYIDYSGTGIDLTTGNKFKYDNNCYPSSTQTTIEGQVIFTDPDYLFTYY